METVDWTTLLAMLSSEKSLAYWHKLELPIKRNQYEQTNLFARGCLELYLYYSIEEKNQNIQDSWKEYENRDGILEKKFLEKNKVQKISDANIEKLFYKTARVLSFTKAKDIYSWAVKFFRDTSDSILEASSMLLFLLENTDNKDRKIVQSVELTEKHTDRIRKFCNRIQRRNDSIHEHFSIATNVYNMTIPNNWEMLLQDYFFEGVRSSYWWMDSVKYSLQYINFYKLWGELQEDIGSNHTTLLLKWLKMNLSSFPKYQYRLGEEDLKRLEKL